MVEDTASCDVILLESGRSNLDLESMRRPRPQIASSGAAPLPKSQDATGKLKYFRPLPYHVALSQAARFEAWMQDVGDVGGPAEAVDSSDYDPRLMEW